MKKSEFVGRIASATEQFMFQNGPRTYPEAARIARANGFLSIGNGLEDPIVKAIVAFHRMTFLNMGVDIMSTVRVIGILENAWEYFDAQQKEKGNVGGGGG